MKRKIIFILLFVLITINLFADHILFPKNNSFGIENNVLFAGNLNNHWVSYNFLQKEDLIKQVNEINDIILKDKRVLLIIEPNYIDKNKYESWLLESVKLLSNKEIVWVINRDKNCKNFKEYVNKSIDIIKKYDKSSFVFINFGNDKKFILNNGNLVLNKYVDGVCYKDINYNTIYQLFMPYILKGKNLTFININNSETSLEKYYINNLSNNIEISIWNKNFCNESKDLDNTYYVYRNLSNLFSQNPYKMINNKYYYEVWSENKLINKSFYSKNKFNDGTERLIIVLWNEENKEENAIIAIRKLIKVRGVYSYDLNSKDFEKGFAKIDYEIRNNDLIINRIIGEKTEILIIDF